MAEAAIHTANDPEQYAERLPTTFDTCYTWNYEATRLELRNLYEKAKRDQWNATDQLAWSTSVDPEAELVPHPARRGGGILQLSLKSGNWVIRRSRDVKTFTQSPNRRMTQSNGV